MKKKKIGNKIKHPVPRPKDICNKCGAKYHDLLGIGSCWKCFYPFYSKDKTTFK